MFDGDSSTTTSLDYAKKAMAADKLAELALIDPKRARRILANRQSVGNLRLHPSAPLLIPREFSEQCQVHDYDIPAGTRVVLNAWAMGRDPMY
ncbi:uncharacterized protein A4U43_UnF3640 [Asparagus officinalis]|uniref:Uncharacterized protein n=2 Tax=Asparagus officinalis TaxID=4686 RepID=A0A1R3L705_ASPOF|nr:uncharacterized protein A4U43_UnF3640 [Asparagus officinalis]